MQRIPNIPLIPLVFASVLSLHGLRRRSLSPSGAAAAFIVGFGMLALPLRTFGVSLIVFYLVGSRATKYGKQLKMQLEDGYHEGGYRTAWQVLCNSSAAFVASVLWGALYVPGSIQATLLSDKLPRLERVAYAPDQWCPLQPGGWSRALLFAMLGHFGCCLGDTLASELGILSRSPPILITTLKPVPPGTNGGLSAVGTLASIAGGLIMGVTLFTSLIVENAICREAWSSILVEVVLWGSIAGGVGSLIDSLLGATVQMSRYSSESKRILSDESGRSAKEKADVKVISGLNILTNNQVNLVSSVTTSLLLARLA